MLSFKHKDQNLTARVDRPQELDTKFINEDGFKRNLLKFKWEWIWARHWANEAKAGHGWIFTAALNKTVEHFRHAPYLWGHIVFYGLSSSAVGALMGVITSAR